MNILIFILIGILGQIAHWAKKWSRGEIECSLLTYIKTNPKHTVGAIITMSISIFGLLSQSPDITLSMQSLSLAFFAGYSADSAINKYD